MPPDIFDDWLKDLEKEKTTEFYEVSEVLFKDKTGKLNRIPIEDIGEEGGPVLNLNLKSTGIRSLNDIINLHEVAPYLKEFSVIAMPTEMVNLEKFRNLRVLSLGGVSMTKIVGLENLRLLKCLSLRSEKIEFMDDLKVLKNLETLSLPNNKIKKIEGIKNFKNLKKIDLSNNQISKIENLEGLENLEILNLSNNQISKIEGLDGLKDLKRLLMSHNQISKIEGLDGLKNVYEISLSHNKITKLENLRKLEGLKMIGLNFNNISKIENLEGLNNLNSISLSNTQIKFLAGIEKLQNLRSIHIDNTKVPSLEPLKKYKGIRYIRANNCPIRSLHGITANLAHLIDLHINPDNLCPTGSQLFKTIIAQRYPLHLPARNVQPLLEFYRRSVTDLALQHANQSKSKSPPLTAFEIERLIHEATQKERMILEDAIDKNLLSSDDYVLSQITTRFSIKTAKGKHLRILL